MPPHIVFDCEVLTPMFVTGADQGSAELRPPSIRGTMRYWYRALLGGRGYTGATLAREEARVFGSAGYKDIEAQAAAVDVVVQLDPDARIERSREPDRRRGGTRPRQDLLRVGSGTGYLWYSAALGQNDRGFFPRGTRFKVALVAPRGDVESLRAAAGAFWLVAHLGGLGTRSRRGAGSFYVRNVRASDDALRASLPAFSTSADDADAYALFLQRGLHRLMESVSRVGAPAEDFDVIAKGKTRIIVAGCDDDSPVGAACWIGEELQAFRTGSWGHRGDTPPRESMEEENRVTKQFVQSGRVPEKFTFRRPGLGLPLAVRYLREKGTGFRGGQADFNAPGLTRRASPMLIHIARLKEGRYDVVLTTFDSHFLPNDSRRLVLTAGRYRTNVTLSPGIAHTFYDEVVAAPEDGVVWAHEVEIPA